MDFISYLKTLSPEDWGKKITAKWTVKDVVAHMIGWEKRDPEIIKKTWETKKLPWWMTTEKDFDAFNKEAVDFYKNDTPEELIKEWEFWQDAVAKEIEIIGEKNLRSRMDLFGWLFVEKRSGNNANDDSNEGHYKHHYNQIKNILGK